MQPSRSRSFTAVALAVVLVFAASPVRARGTPGPSPSSTSAHTPDVIFVPTPEPVVDAMLEMAKVGPKDTVYDLGCGDGRIVIAAAKRGARAVGIDIDPQRIAEARSNAKAAGVEDRVQFVEADLFDADLSKASVITLYLLSGLNMRLRPKLLALPAGTRVVSHAFDMGDWKPEEVREVDGKTVYRWTVPDRAKAQARTAAPTR